MDRSGDSLHFSLSLGGILIAVGVIGLGLFFFFGAWAVTVLPSYARIGPRFFPYIVGSGLVIVGLILLIQPPRPENPDAPDDWSAISWIIAGLIANAALMEWAGYIPATTLLFILAARGLGSRRYAASGLAGLTLALATYLAFTRLLDLRLPEGLLGFVVS